MYDLQIVGLAYDPETRSVFWGTNGRILEAPMIANTVPTTLLDQGRCSICFLVTSYLKSSRSSIFFLSIYLRVMHLV